MDLSHTNLISQCFSNFRYKAYPTKVLNDGGIVDAGNWSKVYRQTRSDLAKFQRWNVIHGRAAGMYEDIRTGPHHVFRIQLTLSHPGGQIMPATVLQFSLC